MALFTIRLNFFKIYLAVSMCDFSLQLEFTKITRARDTDEAGNKTRCNQLSKGPEQRMLQDEFVPLRKRRHSIRNLVPQLVALSGPDCAGKSTLAVDMRKQLNRIGLTVTLLSMDAFLIPRHLRVLNTPEFIEYFESAFDYSALVEALETARCSAPSSPSNGAVLGQQDILLVEGVFLLRRELCRSYDLVEASTSVIINRAINRDKEYFGDEKTVRSVYETRCLPAQRYHMHRDQPKQSLPNSRMGCGWYIDNQSSLKLGD